MHGLHTSNVSSRVESSQVEFELMPIAMTMSRISRFQMSRLRGTKKPGKMTFYFNFKLCDNDASTHSNDKHSLKPVLLSTNDHWVENARIARIATVKPQSRYTSIVFCVSVENWAAVLPEQCVTYVGRVLVRYDCVSTDTCSQHGWAAVGEACQSHALTNAVPDVFLLSCILFLGTFSVAYFLKTFRTSAYFPTKVRILIAPSL